MPRFTLALLLLLASFLAHADPMSMNCSRPTMWDDGSPLAADELMAFKWYGAPAGVGERALLTPTALSDCNFVWDVPASGVWCVVATAIAQAQESGPSEESCQTITVAHAKPLSPGDVTFAMVTKSTVAYTIVSAGKDRLAAVIVGSTPLGTTCDGRQPALNFNVIPRAAVTFTGTLKPDTVVGYCGG